MTHRWILLSVLAISACDLFSAKALTIEKVSGDLQEVQVGSRATFVVRVTEDGDPAARIPVVWTSEGTSVTKETDANGFSEAQWHAGAGSTGLYTVTAALAAKKSAKVEFSFGVVPAASANVR